jgi:hypothetical protein
MATDATASAESETLEYVLRGAPMNMPESNAAPTWHEA